MLCVSDLVHTHCQQNEHKHFQALRWWELTRQECSPLAGRSGPDRTYVGA